jgi:hypothetical protein
MAEIYQFPEKENYEPHSWTHFLWTSVALRWGDYDCMICEKCKRWRIRKKVAGRYLYIKEWVSYEDFRDIIDEKVMADLKPLLVWHLIRLELYLKSARAQSGAKK